MKAPQPHTGTDLLERIAAELPVLTPQLRKVASNLVRWRGLPHNLRAVDLARISGTTATTVSRLAQRYGLSGFDALKAACSHSGITADDPTVPVVADRPTVDQRRAHHALDDMSTTVKALHGIVDHPDFLLATRWLEEAKTVWVAGTSPGDTLAAECVAEFLRHRNTLVRQGWMTHMAIESCARGDTTVQLQVALATELHRANDFLSSVGGHERRRIIVTRSLEPLVLSAGRCLVLGVRIADTGQAVAAALGLASAWCQAMRA